MSRTRYEIVDDGGYAVDQTAAGRPTDGPTEQTRRRWRLDSAASPTIYWRVSRVAQPRLTAVRLTRSLSSAVSLYFRAYILSRKPPPISGARRNTHRHAFFASATLISRLPGARRKISGPIFVNFRTFSGHFGRFEAQGTENARFLCSQILISQADQYCCHKNLTKAMLHVKE